jgi:hypothetical protein
MRLFNWLKPDPLRLKPIMMEEVDPGIYQLTETPFVSVITVRAQRVFPEGFKLLLGMGYRTVRVDVDTLTTIVARPYPVWLFYRAIEAIERGFYSTINALYDGGIIHFSTQEGEHTRWWNIRPGPTREARSFYLHLPGKMWSAVFSRVRRPK